MHTGPFVDYAMQRILFVDDEVAILDGLRNVLRGERRRWTMRFVDCAQAALDALASEPFDVIVSDMRMPTRDGLDLLREVRRAYPQMSRILISSYSELGRAAEASVVAHQHLSKPCHHTLIRAAVERALRVQRLLGDEKLRRVVGGFGALPLAPRTYQAITVALGDPDTDLKKLADIVERDIGMASRLLKLANSAYVGLSKRISNIEEAVVLLGTNAVRHLALTVEVFSGWGGAPPALLEQLGAHAVLTARIARRMVPERAEADVAFAAGLLHDVGKLVLMRGAPEPFAAATEEASRRHVPGHVVEAEVFGITHAEVGGYLLSLWDLPHAVVEPVALHHNRAPVAGLDTAGTVALANLLAVEATATQGNDGCTALDGVEDVSRWRELARREASVAP